MKRKIVSWVLSLALVVSLVPGMSLTALADGTPAYSGGTGTEADPYLISTADDWKALVATVNSGEAYEDEYFRQTANLDMSEAGNLNPVGTLAAPFAGNYEGDGFAISNATITGVTSSVQSYNTNVAGVFGALVGGGSISNLMVTNVSVTATSGDDGWDQAYAGGLVAFAEDCTITDCSVSGSTITAGDSNVFAGAFVGFAGAENSEKTEFSKCASENNTVNTYDYGGGFIGAIVNTTDDSAISFTDCYSANNTVDAGTHNYGTVGGFLGGSQGEPPHGNMTVQNCFVYNCIATATGIGAGKGLFTGDTTYGTVIATNSYYYNTNNLALNDVSATSKTVDEMKSLASTLGEAFTQGSDYPILLHPVNIEVSIEGWTSGEEAKEPSITGNNGNGAVTYQYKVKGAADETYSETVPTEAGDYTVKVTVAATSTHKEAVATADFTIAAAPINPRPSSGGGGSSVASYDIVVTDTTNGTVTPDRANVGVGTRVTVTVTPDAGYKLDTLTATDKNDKDVALTRGDDGTYTFTMPNSKVTLSAAFVSDGTQPTPPAPTPSDNEKFVDVPKDAYYHDAVYWAVDKGITEGTDATHFSPDATCTRAQMVTFLWRDAGQPAPTSSENPFTDVKEGAYYYDAVLWAVENGITVGTSSTTFSPDDTIIRGQTVTFLWRYEGQPAPGSSENPFTDVTSSDYFYQPVLWAVEKNVTAGTSKTTFSPQANCLRSQVVTFLNRAAGQE